jgi:hypothetical protein
MIIEYVFGASIARAVSGFSRQIARLRCGAHGHTVMLHFEPDRLSLQCSMCGYESEGWEVGRAMTTSRKVTEVRQIRPLTSGARLAS